MSRFLSACSVLLAASTALSGQTYKVIHNFGAKAGDPSQPNGPGIIAQGRGGEMMTTASTKAFRISTSGSLQVLHQFDSSSNSGLVLARDGRFYGTAAGGGTFNAGTVFNMAPDGTVTTLYNFTGGSDGASPQAPPIQSVDGDFYGTAYGGGTSQGYNAGTVYKISKDGNFTLLYDFAGGSADGQSPWAPLVQGTDYRFYGTTTEGGWNNSDNGTLFRISSTGSYKRIESLNGFDGEYLWSWLIQANDGNFYGVANMGGEFNYGVLFRKTPGGPLTVLHNFSGGSDGGCLGGGLVQASDGNLYGTNSCGGAYGSGVLYRATLAGDVVPLHDFHTWTGKNPTSLLQHTNGVLYGDTQEGGKFGQGVFYSLDAGLPPFVTYLPVYGKPGAEVQILGQGFTAGSQVLFNGTPAASPVVVYPTYLRVIVPSGATTGPITVTTTTGTLTSNKVFVVHP